jgi:hypothetical protein
MIWIASRAVVVRSFAALLLALPFSHCASSGAVPRLYSGQAAAHQVQLRVTNQGARDVVVYLAGGTAQHRLGRVLSTQQVDLSIGGQSRVGAPIRLLLRDVGTGETFTMDPVWGRAGDVIDLTIHPLLATSEAMVR